MGDSAVVDTAAGPIEYAMAGGDGPVVVVLHGALGSCAQGLHVLGFLRDAGFGVLAMSRPGYAGTPLSVGRTYAEQADALALLLDALDIRPVAVCGASAGGPIALQFAVRHPARTAALVMFSGLALGPDRPVGRLRMTLGGSAATFRLAGWLSALPRFERRFVRGGVRSFSTFDRCRVEAEADAILRSEVRLADFRGYFPPGPDWSRHIPGMQNDIKQNVSLDPSAYPSITAPTLLVHGDMDGSAASVEHARYLHRTIPGAQLHVVEGGWHVLSLSPGMDAARGVIFDFLQSTPITG